MAGLKVVKKGDRVIKEYVDGKTGKITVYEPGIRLEVSDFKGNWYPVKVLEVDHEENEVLVHYDKWSSRYDEWIKTDSNRLRPTSDTNQVKIQFKVGERVEALWSTDGQRYPGTIKGIHPNDYYEVLFDDGIKCKKKVSQIFKIQRITRRAAAATTTSSNKVPRKDSPSVPEGSLRKRREREDGTTSPDLTLSPSVGPELPQSSSSSDLPETSTTNPDEPKLVPPTGPHHSIFEPVPTELGKRKRAYHDYSLFLKIPKKSPKPVRSDVEKRRKSVRLPEQNQQVEEAAEAPEPEEIPEVDPVDLPTKRSRKSSMKAIESIASADPSEKGRRGQGRRKSASVLSHNESQHEQSEMESNFVDEEGKVVEIEKTSDGGRICPVESCGKTLRKDSLLQMHLKHYHPTSNIQYLGKKMNVFEMAIAKARRGSNEEDIEIPPPSPELVLPAVVPAAGKSRRRSSPVPSVVETTPQVPQVIQEEPEATEKPPQSSEEPTKINTNVCVLLEKINLSNLPGVNRTSSRVSQRGRVLAPRRWGRSYSDVDVDSAEDDPTSEDESSEPKRKAQGYNKTNNRKSSDNSSKRSRRLDGEQQQEESCSSFNGPEQQHVVVQEKKLKRLVDNNNKHNRSSYDGIPRGPGRPPLYPRRGKKLTGNTLLCGMKSKKLELIYDELLNNVDRSKKIVAKAGFEDVKVDVINCECGLEEEFGLMMQCELCQAWQHGNCYDIFEVTQLPRYYVCSFCREPKNLRQSSRHEWYQEVNTTGRLPRFSFSSANEPDTEDRMRGSNDLLNCLATVQSLLRSTQMKIGLLNSAQDNPKLVLWSKKQDHPLQSVRREDFKLNFRSILRQLLRQNFKDPDYIGRLRSSVQDQLNKSHNKPDMTRIGDAVGKRLNSRAWKMIQEELDWKKAKGPHHSNNVSNIQTDDSSNGLFDSFDVDMKGENSSLLSPVPPDLDNSGMTSTIEKLASDLQERDPDSCLVQKDSHKFLMLTKSLDWKKEGPVRAIDGGLNGIVGVGKVLDQVKGVEGLAIVQVEGPSNDQDQVDFQLVNKLGVCKICKDGLEVGWSRKKFVKESDLRVRLPKNEALQAHDESQDILEAQESKVKPLKVLCQDKLKDFNLLQESPTPSTSEFDLPVHRKITAKSCRSNLHAAVIREQAVLDLHLDMIEEKLKELEKAGFSNPQAALTKLKDLEELKCKVQQINDSVEFMRKVPAGNARGKADS